MGPVTGNFQTQNLWVARDQGYISVLSFEVANSRAHAQGACQKKTDLVPQCPPSGIMQSAIQKVKSRGAAVSAW